MKAELSIFRLSQRLKTPYRLSFGTLTAFETLVVRLRAGGAEGYGEITPLPGYSHETIDSTSAALERAGRALEAGRDFGEVVAGLVDADPMVASALECAWETRGEGLQSALMEAVPGRSPLAALCGGVSPEEATAQAGDLIRSGYRHLKMKIGGGKIDDDIARVAAVAAQMSGDAGISLDANQCLSPSDARRVCDAAADLPVTLVEQPFPPDAGAAFAELAKATSVPLMLDESIWSAGDIDTAAQLGAAFVKLKLCKHPGIAANLELIGRARSRGLRVIFGNGVQGALGNHLEARIYRAAGLDTPAEFNGVLKVAKDPFNARFTVANGEMTAGGMPDPGAVLDGLKPLSTFVFTP